MTVKEIYHRVHSCFVCFHYFSCLYVVIFESNKNLFFVQLLKFWKNTKNAHPKCNKFDILVSIVEDNEEQTINFEWPYDHYKRQLLYKVAR